MLETTVRGLLAGFPGSVGIVVENLSTGETARINESEVFPAASIIKLPILWELFRQAEEGCISMEQRITLVEAAKAGGSGILQELAPGLRPTIKDLATLMIIVSDNTATNYLIDRMGFESVNQTISELGLKNTILQRRMMDSERAQQGFDNYTTAAEMATLLAAILSSEKLTAASRDAMLDILQRQQYNDRLSAAWPEETIFAHKTGQLPGIEHDAGILFLQEQTIILVALTSDPAESRAGIRLLTDIGQLVYHHYGKE